MTGTDLTNEPTIASLKAEIDFLDEQLAATREREKKLRETLTIIDIQALNVMQDDVSPYGAILKCGWVHEKCKEALHPSEYLENTDKKGKADE